MTQVKNTPNEKEINETPIENTAESFEPQKEKEKENVPEKQETGQTVRVERERKTQRVQLVKLSSMILATELD